MLPLRSYLCFTGILLCLSWFRAGGQTVDITEHATSYFTGGGWSYYTTNSTSETINSIIGNYRNNQFIPVNKGVLNGGIPDKHYWFHFSIKNADAYNNNLIIDIQSPRLTELELYEVVNNSVRSIGKMGNSFKFRQRLFFDKNFIYQVNVNKGQIKDYFLYVNQIGHTFILPIVVHTEEGYKEVANRNYLIDGIVYGSLVFVALLSLLLFINTGHRLYLYYSLYILSAILWFLSYFGLGFQYIWPANPAFNTIGAPFFSSMNLFLNIQISQTLLELKKRNKKLYTAGNFTKVLLLLVAFYPVFVNLNSYGYARNHNYLLIFLSVIILSISIVFISIVSPSIKGFSTAQYYFIASLLKLGSIFNLALLELGISPGLYHLEGFLQFGILIEIILLTYALAKRYTNYRFNSYLKVVAAQEQERAKIKQEMHDGIKSMVSGVKYYISGMLKAEQFNGHSSTQALIRTIDVMRDIEHEIDYISENLMPDYINKHTIKQAAEILINNIQERINSSQGSMHSLIIKFTSNKENDSSKFSETVKLSIYRILQEVITNIIKHSDATEAEIEFIYKKRELTIKAKDNGIGLALQEGVKHKGMGLKNMESRVKVIYGTFSINDSQVNNTNSSGTCINITIPYKQGISKETTLYEY